MEDTDFLIPDVIERLVRCSSVAVILRLGTLSKRWREVVHSRTLWRGFDRKKVFCLPRTLISSAYIAAISSIWNGHQATLPISPANLTPDADHAQQLKKLQQIFPLAEAYHVHITFIVDNHRHLISGDKKVQIALLKVIKVLVLSAPLPCIKILIDFLLPHLDQFLVSFTAKQQDELEMVISVITLCLKHAAIRRQRQYLKEFLSRGLLKKILPNIRQSGHLELLEQVLLDADQHATEILPVVDIVTGLYNTSQYAGFLVLIRSTNVQIWKEIFASLEKCSNFRWPLSPAAAKMMAVTQEALAAMFEKDLPAFVQLSQWPGARDDIAASIKYLTKSMSTATMKELHQFIQEKLLKCEGWIQITYIQSLIENNFVKKVLESIDDSSAFSILRFILANSSAEQDEILKKYEVLQQIGLKTRSKNSDERAAARSVVEILSKKRVFAPLVVQQIQNKTIRV